MQLLHSGVIWKIRVENKAQRGVLWLSRDLEQSAERGVKQGLGVVWALPLGSGCASLQLHFTLLGQGTQDRHSRQESAWLVSFPPLCVAVPVP